MEDWLECQLLLTPSLDIVKTEPLLSTGLLQELTLAWVHSRIEIYWGFYDRLTVNKVKTKPNNPHHLRHSRCH